jgi:hypothetical protein
MITKAPDQSNIKITNAPGEPQYYLYSPNTSDESTDWLVSQQSVDFEPFPQNIGKLLKCKID